MRTIRYAALLLAFASPTALLAQAAPDSRLTGQDLFSLEVAADPQIAPDGSAIAFVRRANDIMSDKAVSSIWLVNTASGEMTPVAAGPGGHSQPRWSPDGKRLAYVSTAEGGAPQLYVRWMASGEAVRITGLPESPGNIAWSPDGTQIAYTLFVAAEGPRLGKAPEKPEGATWAAPLETYDLLAYRADGAGYIKPGFDKIFVVPATGGAPRQLSFGDYHDGGGLTWSKDGSTLYFSGNRSPDWESDPVDAEIYALDIASGTIAALTDRDGPDASPVVSPDGSKIAYLGFDDKLLGYHNAQAYVMNRDGSGKRAVAPSLDRSIDTLVWAPDGQALIAQYDDHGETLVARIGMDGSVREIVRGLTGPSLDRPYSGGSFSVAKSGAIAYSGGNATKPADIMLASGGK
ncbi:MAG: TolB family protein, partial [Blastomonas fulva]|uniref:TolB family protein n=1 Tax=Blastomonas fulva TaxID=1550728 RepID=UPI0040347E12